MKLFDSHAHLSFPQYPPAERLSILERALIQGVTDIMNVATDTETLGAGLALEVPEGVSVLLSAATHPHDLKTADDPLFPEVASLAREGKLAAVGETGLDFFHGPDTKELQRTIFLRYIALAQEVGLPLIIHCRDAFDDLFALLREVGIPLHGVLHCFTGTEQEAKQVLDLGGYISISGIVTFPKSHQLREVVAYLPLDKILVETDAPYLAPQAKRGLRNEPSFLIHTVEAIARLKNLPTDVVASATRNNALSLFTPTK